MSSLQPLTKVDLPIFTVLLFSGIGFYLFPMPGLNDSIPGIYFGMCLLPSALIFYLIVYYNDRLYKKRLNLK